MKRKLIAFTTSLMLLLSILVVGNVGAHPVTVIDPATTLPDRSRNEWFGSIYGEPPDSGTGMIERNSTNQGEFVFNDYVDKKLDPILANNDHRVLTTTNELTKSTDLDWFAITGDADNISFLAKIDSIKAITANPVPELMVSIDTGAGANNTALPGLNVNTSINSAAAWEYVVQTDFSTAVGTGNVRPPKLWTTPTGSGGSCQGCQAQLVGGSNGGLPGSFIEIKVPWQRIGGKPASSKSLRFTASIFRKDHLHPQDGFASALIDAASTKKTYQILSQDNATINTFFELYFDANGDVYSPLLISEFQPNPSGTEPPGPNGVGTEWIEIYNASNFYSPPGGFSIQLNNYKIGDAAGKGSSSEGMLRFPNKLLNPGEVVIVAQRKDVLAKVFPNITATVYDQTQLSPYLPWAAKNTVGLDNQRDQLVLLDGSDTIADFVEYTVEGSLQAPFVNSTPITFPPAGPPEGNSYSYERCPSANDTNNADIDFLTHDGFTGGSPTPGVPCPPATGVDLRIAKTVSSPSVLAGSNVSFVLDWSNNGDGAFSSIVVTDTLPAGLEFVSQTSSPQAAFTQTGQDLSWNFTNQTTNVSGTITLVAKVADNAPANVPLVNTAGVRSNDPGRTETDPLKLADNFATASVTALAPDLTVVSTFPGGVLQGADFTYVISATNLGTGDATGVVVTDTLPSGLTFLSGGSTPPASVTTVGGNQVVVWNVGDLGAGATDAIDVHVQLSPSVPALTQLTNKIEISGTPPDGGVNPAPNVEQKTLVVNVIPDLSVSTAGWPSSAVPGSQFCYTINYAYGPANAPQTTNVEIKDVLPQYMTLVSQTGAGLTFNNATSGELVWTRPSMSAGQSGTINVCVKVSANATTGLKVNNLVTITGSFDSNLTGNNVDTKQLTYDKSRLYIPIIIK